MGHCSDAAYEEQLCWRSCARRRDLSSIQRDRRAFHAGGIGQTDKPAFTRRASDGAACWADLRARHGDMSAGVPSNLSLGGGTLGLAPRPAAQLGFKIVCRRGGFRVSRCVCSALGCVPVRAGQIRQE
jgi:hypothetical protein